MVMIVRHPSIPPSLYTVMGRYSGPRHAEVISDRQAAALILLIVAGGCQYCPQCPALSSVEEGGEVDIKLGWTRGQEEDCTLPQTHLQLSSS